MPTLDYLDQLQKEYDERKRILLSYGSPVFDRSFDEALQEALTLNPIIIAPYTHSYPEHIEALSKIGYPVVRIPCDHETAYYEAIVAVYKTGKEVIVIEHDMVPRETDVQELLDCPHSWCGFTYYHRYRKVKACLGLTKLAFFNELPKIFETVTKNWRYLDGELEARLFTAGYKIHEHTPLAIHLNPLIEVPGPTEEVDQTEERMMMQALFISRNPDWIDPMKTINTTNDACTLTHPCGVCYGCGLRAKNLSIQGETVAGHTFGTPYYPVLIDKATDQGVVAGEAWGKISQEMQKGGAVAEDKLQQPMEIQRDRANAATAEVGREFRKNRIHQAFKQ